MSTETKFICDICGEEDIHEGSTIHVDKIENKIPYIVSISDCKLLKAVSFGSLEPKHICCSCEYHIYHSVQSRVEP